MADLLGGWSLINWSLEIDTWTLYGTRRSRDSSVGWQVYKEPHPEGVRIDPERSEVVTSPTVPYVVVTD